MLRLLRAGVLLDRHNVVRWSVYRRQPAVIVFVFTADDGQETRLQPARHRAHTPLAHFDLVDAADWGDLACGAREEQRYFSKVFNFINENNILIRLVQGLIWP